MFTEQKSVIERGLKSALKLLILLLGLCQLPDAALATTITGSFTGTFVSGTTDTYGFFGKAGANLAGSTITDHFSFSPIGQNTYTGQYPNYYAVYADPAGGISPHPTWSNSVTAGGVTLSVSSSNVIDVLSFFGPSGVPGGDITYDINPDPGAALAMEFSLWTTAVNANDFLSQDQFDKVTSGWQLFPEGGADRFGLGISGEFEYLYFDVNSPQPGASTVSAVPEMATWSMMLAGFAGVALRLRSRKVGAGSMADKKEAAFQ